MGLYLTSAVCFQSYAMFVVVQVARTPELDRYFFGAHTHTHTRSFSEECQIDRKEFLSLLEGEIRFAMHGFVTLLIRGLGFHL